MKLDDALSRIRELLEQPLDTESSDEFSELLDEVALSSDSTAISRLLALIDDRREDDFTNFALVHAAESFPVRDYIGQFLVALPDVWRRSPGWARTLLSRIINAPGMTEEIVTAAASASIEEQEALQQTISYLLEWRPDVQERVNRLLDVLRS
jgi:Immunity protein 30